MVPALHRAQQQPRPQVAVVLARGQSALGAPTGEPEGDGAQPAHRAGEEATGKGEHEAVLQGDDV
jgi:hypothetical protein